MEKTKRITIGRDKKCDLVIEDNLQNAKVSGFHATISEAVALDSANKVFILEDHSTNGTYVNSRLVHNGTYKIQIGDTITLGHDYVLDWNLILPFFEGRKTQGKPKENETEGRPQNGTQPNNGFYSADPVYPDSLPKIVEEPVPPIIDEQPLETDEKEGFVFTGLHWLIVIGAAIIGFVLGLLLK